MVALENILCKSNDVVLFNNSSVALFPVSCHGASSVTWTGRKCFILFCRMPTLVALNPVCHCVLKWPRRTSTEGWKDLNHWWYGMTPSCDWLPTWWFQNSSTEETICQDNFILKMFTQVEIAIHLRFIKSYIAYTPLTSETTVWQCCEFGVVGVPVSRSASTSVCVTNHVYALFTHANL